MVVSSRVHSVSPFGNSRAIRWRSFWLGENDTYVDGEWWLLLLGSAAISVTQDDPSGYQRLMFLEGNRVNSLDRFIDFTRVVRAPIPTYLGL